jgi:His-Xaa-Ser system protein HxsD
MALPDRTLATKRADKITLELEPRQFSREAALKAAYWFTKDLHIEFPPSPSEESFTVVLRLKEALPSLENPAPKSLDHFASEFRNALIEAELRVQVQRETSMVRELVLAKAFAEAGVLESAPSGSFSDPVLASETRKGESDLVRIDDRQVPDKPSSSD